MAKVKLTFGRVTGFKCPDDAAQAFLWCDEVPGLAVRATPGSSRNRYIFQSKVNKQTRRITIGDVSIWSIGDAQIEARRLQTIIDQGNDPREVKADQAAAKTAATIAKKAQETRETATVSSAWVNYLEYQKDKMQRSHIERGKRWGARHLKDHENLSQAGGIEKQRGKGLTKPGVLYPLLLMRMIDINADVLKEWQKQEAETRANNARQGYEMFRAFWRWCASRPEYTNIIDVEAIESKELRDEVPSRKSKQFDVMQRAHLPSWFAAVRSLNPIISAYLQALLLTGTRREEMASLTWQDVDFKWNSIWVKDKVHEEGRKIPLTPYLARLLTSLPRRNQWVFSSTSAANGRITEPRIPHNRALSIGGLPPLTLHGLRRTFASLAEWVEMPKGIVAQIMGHAPSATAERHYINRPLELLAIWHMKYEAWILKEAEIEFKTTKAGLRAITAA
ncbi:tyrosine-type recombinase/integrase [Nitrosomonas sp.]|uniref:tyrosine-type recombinase/integrase n=1 Tax=Nitrosomonas sp. TaxID=42353 RepID=UPI00374D14E6